MEKRPGSALTKKNQKADLQGKLTPNMSLWSGEGALEPAATAVSEWA